MPPGVSWSIKQDEDGQKTEALWNYTNTGIKGSMAKSHINNMI